MNNSSGALSFDAIINNTDFKRQLDSMEQQLKGFGGTAEKEGQKMEDSFKKVGMAIGAYFTFAGAQQFINKMIQIRGEFQQLEIGLKTMLGSKEKADKLFAEMVELAAKTPFTLTDVAAGGKQLIAYGTSAEIVTEKLRRLGDIAAGTNAPLQDLVYLYGTSRTQGRLFQRDILQFAGRGVPIFKELAAVMGVAEKEVAGLVSAGKVGFEELDAVITNLTSDGGMFFNLMKEQSMSVTGQISNLKDAFDEMLNSLGEDSEGAIYAGISVTTDLIKNYETIGKILMELIVIYGTYKAVLITLSAIEAFRASMVAINVAGGGAMTTSAIIYTMALKKLAQVQLLVSSTNPFGLAGMAIAATVTAIAGLIGYLTIFADKSTDASRAAEEHAKALEEVNNQYDRESANVSVLVNTARNEALLRKTRIQALKDLKAAAGGWLDALTLENIKTKEGMEILADYNDELKRSITLQGNKDEMVAVIIRLNQIAREKKALQDKIDAANANKTGGQITSLKPDVLAPFDDPWEARANDLTDERTKLMAEETELTITLKALQNDRLKIQLKSNEAEKEVAASDKLSIEQIDTMIEKHKEDLKLVKEGEKAKYDSIQADIKKLEDRKKALTGGSKSDLNKEESEATKKSLTLYERLMDEKKRAYELYDKWVRFVGKESADEQFKTLISAGASYYQWINGEIARLSAKSKKTKAEIEMLETLTEAQKPAEVEDTDSRVQSSVSAVESKLDLLEKTKDKIKLIEDEISKIPTEGEENIKKRIELSKRLSELRHTDEVEQAEHLRQLLEDNKDYQERRKALEVEGEKEIAELIALGFKNRAEERRKKLKKDLADLQESVDKLNEKFGKRATQFSTVGVNTLSIYKDLLGNVLTDPDISAEVKATVNQILIGVQDAIDKKSGIAYSKYMAARARYKAAMKGDFEEQALAFGEMIEAGEEFRVELADGFSEVSSGLSSLSTAAGEFDQELASILNTAAQVAGGLAKIASGKYFEGIVQMAASILSAVMQHRAQEEKRQEEGRIELLQKQRDLLQQINESIARQIALTDRLYGSDKLENYVLSFSKIQAAITETIKDIDRLTVTFRELATAENKPGRAGFNNRTGTPDYAGIRGTLDRYITTSDELFRNPNFNPRDPASSQWLNGGNTIIKNIDELLSANQDARVELYDKLADESITGKEAEDLRVLLDALEEQSDQFIQLKNQYSQLITGTTLTNIVDSIAEGFAAGKDSAADFADSFRDLMKNAIIQALKIKALEEPLSAWYDQFVTMAGDEEGLTAAEIETLRLVYNEVITGASEQWDALQGILNDAQIGGSSTQLSGAIASISEDTAGVIAGQMNAIRITQGQALTALMADVQANEETAKNTRYLKQMYDVMTGGAVNELGGTGIKY